MGECSEPHAEESDFVSYVVMPLPNCIGGKDMHVITHVYIQSSSSGSTYALRFMLMTLVSKHDYGLTINCPHKTITAVCFRNSQYWLNKKLGLQLPRQQA